MISSWVTRAVSAGAVIVAASLPLWAQSADEVRSAWRYRRTVTAPAATTTSLVAIPVPPDLQARAQADLRDLRLIDASGRELPFLIHEDRARRVEQSWIPTLREAQQERRDDSTWILDLGETASIDRVILDVPDRDFAKRLTVDLSDDGQQWRELARDLWIFDREWQGARVHETAITMPRANARFVRLQADDTSSTPVGIRGATALRIDALVGTEWTEERRLEVIATENGRTRYRIPVADGHPAARLSIDADDSMFARTVRILETEQGSDRQIGTALAYRLRLPGATAALESREIDVTRNAGGPLFVEITDGDGAPLRDPRVRLSGPRTMLLTPTDGAQLTLYYGNPVTRAPVYALEGLRTALAGVAGYPSAALGPEALNPSFRQPAPLAFVAARGATITPAGWRFSRSLRITAGEDLYTVAVPPRDAARLRPDYGDLRLVDDTNRQLPYVLESSGATAVVPLSIASDAPRRGIRQTSAYRLSLEREGTSGELRIEGLRLRIAEPFFQRTVTVLERQWQSPLGAEPVAAATLTARRTGETQPAWVDVSFGQRRGAEWLLEINDGDNAPLTLLEAVAVVSVPRLTFKAGPGEYRLLSGNAEAAPPSYELGLLRQEVLAYAATPLDAGNDTAAANPVYERTMADYVRDAPPRAILWTALGVAVLVLVVLTRRILAAESPGGDGTR